MKITIYSGSQMQMVPQSNGGPLGLYWAEPAEYQHFQGFCYWQWPKHQFNEISVVVEIE